MLYLSPATWKRRIQLRASGSTETSSVSPVSGRALHPELPQQPSTRRACAAGSASNSDLEEGRVTLSAGAATYTLTGTYTTAPNCLTADVTTPGNASHVTESITALTFAHARVLMSSSTSAWG